MSFLVLRSVLTLAAAAVWLRLRRADEWREWVAISREFNRQQARREQA